MKKIKTVQNVMDAASELAAFRQPHHANLFVAAGDFMCLGRWELDSRDAVGLALVAMGTTLPETFLLTCPASDYLRELSLATQKKYIVDGQLVLTYRRDKHGRQRFVRVPAKNLTEEDCELICKFKPMAPMMTAYLDGDDVVFTFAMDAHTGQAIKCLSASSVHRDNPGQKR